MTKMPCHITDGPSDPDEGDDLFCHLHQMGYASTESCEGCKEDRHERNAKQAAEDTLEVLAGIARGNGFNEDDEAEFLHEVNRP